MDFRDRQEWIEEGEFLIVPRGVEHRPVAEEEVAVLLFEPASTLNTGNVQDDALTRAYSAAVVGCRHAAADCSRPRLQSRPTLGRD